MDGWMDGKARLRIAYSNQKYAEEKIESILVYLDTKKAFDSLSHKCIEETP